jgi:subtilisin family serine protease
MRKAVFATLLCGAPLLAAPAQASQGLLERQALREAARVEARAAGSGTVVRLPLPQTVPTTGGEVASTASSRVVPRIAASSGPQRVLVGVRSHGQLRGVARTLRRLGAAPEAFEPIGVLAATVPSGTALARALGDDPRVAYVERDTQLPVAADPFDVPDPHHGGIKYTWYFDDVRAADALAAAGGGSKRTVAVMDTGLDRTHPEFAGRIARVYDTHLGGKEVNDVVGHGTFVTGLIAAIDGNGIGGKGVAGNTKVLAIRGSRDGSFTERDLLRGIAFAVRRGADVLNLSLAGDGVPLSVERALAAAFYNDVLPVAASGNLGNRKNDAGVFNPVQYPAAVLGGRKGAPGIGLSVAATRPNGTHAGFSTHNRYVSLSGPGASTGDCRFGVLSTLPATLDTEWDAPDSCNKVFAQGGLRFAYGEGTSFSAPIVSGIAALVWQVEPRLASEQVAEVLIRSARQTRGEGWNEYTGAGIVDGKAATDLARVYDVTAPKARADAQRLGNLVSVRMARTKDRTEQGRELAARVTYGLLVSRNGGHNFSVVASRRKRPIRRMVELRGGRINVVAATACDGNGNCAVRRLGRFEP